MTTWTIKSPWRIVEHNWEDTSIYDAEDDVICTITISVDVTEETQSHYEQIVAEKARAIASLPDLIEAVEQVLSEQNRLVSGHLVLDDAEELALRSALLKIKEAR